MWKCKECGGQIYGNVIGTIKNGWGYIGEDGCVTELQEYDLDFFATSFHCDDCENKSLYLEEIAVCED